MQIAAAKHLVENGGNKADALRAAGYSEAVVHTPSKVFDSPAVRAILEENGISEVAVAKVLQRKLKSRRLDHMVFPLYNEDIDGSGGDEDGDAQELDDLPEPQDDLEQALEALAMRGHDGDFIVERGKAMSDKQIVEMLEEQGCRVRRIQHGRTARHVYFWVDNDKSQLEALDMVFNLLGSYAPKKSEVKAQVGIFSLKNLRRDGNQDEHNT